MNDRRLCCLLALSAIGLLAASAPARADVTLPNVLGSHMVLQRDQLLPIWGHADPGEAVAVRLDSGAAGRDGGVENA